LIRTHLVYCLERLHRTWNISWEISEVSRQIRATNWQDVKYHQNIIIRILLIQHQSPALHSSPSSEPLPFLLSSPDFPQPVESAEEPAEFLHPETSFLPVQDEFAPYQSVPQFPAQDYPPPVSVNNYPVKPHSTSITTMGILSYYIYASTIINLGVKGEPQITHRRKGGG